MQINGLINNLFSIAFPPIDRFTMSWQTIPLKTLYVKSSNRGKGMNVKGKAMPSLRCEEVSHAGSADDAALDWGGRALRAESDRVSALMSASVPRSLSLFESGLPVKGLAWRHRLSRVPACLSPAAEPQAPRMLDGPSALSVHQEVSLAGVKLPSAPRGLPEVGSISERLHLKPGGVRAPGFCDQKKVCSGESKPTAGGLALERRKLCYQRRLGSSACMLLLGLLKQGRLIAGPVPPHAIHVG
jgi:hypothetical protein